MARKPDTPCSSCGKLLWGGTTSLPAGERTCQKCRRAGESKDAKRSGVAAICAHCSAPYSSVRRSDGRWTRCCGKRCAQLLRSRESGRRLGPATRRASWRAKNHRRRTQGRVGFDVVTASFEQALRVRARRCPMCAVLMTSYPFLPNSKELDHIVPLNTGGTHTVGNVRIICRSCNLARPKDGSDYTGPVTLWALAEVG